MFKKIVVFLMLVVFCVGSANAFEVGDYKFRNKLSLFHVESGSGDENKNDYQIIHDIKVSKKGFPVWLQNRYQYDHYEDGIDARYYFKTSLGYEVNKNLSLVTQRQEYNYRSTNDILYRFGVEISF